MKLALALLTVAALLLTAAPADARDHLTRREARPAALKFLTPFVRMISIEETVTPIMTPARHCRSYSRRTVACRFGVPFHGITIRGAMVVHLQRDGLLGFLIARVDLTDYWVPTTGYTVTPPAKLR